MLFVLDSLPISVDLLKQTKIGKAINHILKSNKLPPKTNDKAVLLVNRWKKMVYGNYDNLIYIICYNDTD